MAKLKNTTETELKETPMGGPDSSATLEPVAPVAVSSTPSASTPEEMPAPVREVLKIYPGCASLYVDAFGGVYTEDTPEVIRGKAKLYKNPFFQS